MAKFSPDEYRHERNAVSLLNYHFVLSQKRRRKVLIGAIAERLQQMIGDVYKLYKVYPENPVT